MLDFASQQKSCSLLMLLIRKTLSLLLSLSSIIYGLSLQLDINTVAAGGGSTLSFRSGMFIVGPESAGANPGPACYGRGEIIYFCVQISLCGLVVLYVK